MSNQKKKLDIEANLEKIHKVRDEWAKSALSTQKIDTLDFEKHMKEFYDFSTKLCDVPAKPLVFKRVPSPTGLFGILLQDTPTEGGGWHWQSVINSAIDSAMADMIENLTELKNAASHLVLYEQIFNNAQDACTYFEYGSIANTPATYICARDIFGIKAPQEFDELFNYFEKSLKLGNIWVVKNGIKEGEPITILYSERPSAVHTNENGFSCTTGPAIDWPDFKFYFIDGVRVAGPGEDEWKSIVVTDPSKITVKNIQDERNAELRRIMLERMGYDRFIEESEADLLDMDSHSHNGTRALFKTAIGNLLHCACPTTSRTYWMQVPEDRTTCEDADKFLAGPTVEAKKCIGAS